MRETTVTIGVHAEDPDGNPLDVTVRVVSSLPADQVLSHAADGAEDVLYASGAVEPPLARQLVHPGPDVAAFGEGSQQ